MANKVLTNKDFKEIYKNTKLAESSEAFSDFDKPYFLIESSALYWENASRCLFELYPDDSDSDDQPIYGAANINYCIFLEPEEDDEFQTDKSERKIPLAFKLDEENEIVVFCDVNEDDATEITYGSLRDHLQGFPRRWTAGISRNLAKRFFPDSYDDIQDCPTMDVGDGFLQFWFNGYNEERCEHPKKIVGDKKMANRMLTNEDFKKIYKNARLLENEDDNSSENRYPGYRHSYFIVEDSILPWEGAEELTTELIQDDPDADDDTPIYGFAEMGYLVFLNPDDDTDTYLKVRPAKELVPLAFRIEDRQVIFCDASEDGATEITYGFVREGLPGLPHDYASGISKELLKRFYPDCYEDFQDCTMMETFYFSPSKYEDFPNYNTNHSGKPCIRFWFNGYNEDTSTHM